MRNLKSLRRSQTHITVQQIPEPFPLRTYHQIKTDIQELEQLSKNINALAIKRFKTTFGDTTLLDHQLW